MDSIKLKLSIKWRCKCMQLDTCLTNPRNNKPSFCSSPAHTEYTVVIGCRAFWMDLMSDIYNTHLCARQVSTYILLECSTVLACKTTQTCHCFTALKKNQETCVFFTRLSLGKMTCSSLCGTSLHFAAGRFHLKTSVALNSSRPHPFLLPSQRANTCKHLRETQSQIVLYQRENISRGTCLLQSLARNKNRRLMAKCIWHGLTEHATTTMASNHKTAHVVVNIHFGLWH